MNNNRPALRLAWPPPSTSISEKKISSGELNALIALAQAEERKLMGQELHDNVNQILTTVSLYLQMMRPEGKRDKTIQQKGLEYLNLAIEELRKISGELVMSKQIEKGLVESINAILGDINFSTSLKIEFNYSDDIESLRQDKKTALLRIVQEQLNNILKYSNATGVKINLIVRNGEATLQIEDNGVGFDPAKTRTGIGLANIYDRAQFYNGSVKLQTGEGKGCYLSIIIPAA